MRCGLIRHQPNGHALEKQYILGDSKAVNDPHNHFESILRVELLEQIPDFMSQMCTHDSRQSMILWE
eukprot:3435795-Amphidinium_carterae.2